jgi:hypothetical protein
VGQGRVDLGEEAVALLGDAEDLAELAGGDQQAGAGLEPGQDGGGDEVGEVPQPQHPGGQQQGPAEGGQGGRRTYRPTWTGSPAMVA